MNNSNDNIVIKFAHVAAFLAVITFLLPKYTIFLFGQEIALFEFIISLSLPLFFIINQSFNKYILCAFAFLFLHGCFLIVLEKNDAFFFKIFFGTFLAYLFYYLSIIIARYDMNLFIKYYLNGVLIISLIGIIQFISMKLNFKDGYDFTWIIPEHRHTTEHRINSIFPEPSQLGQVFAPAFFLALTRIIGLHDRYLSKFSSLLIILVYLLSQSSLAIIGVIASIAILALNFFSFSRMFMSFFSIGGVLILFYNISENFKSKIDSVRILFVEREVVADYSLYGGSFFTLYDHFQTAVQNFRHFPIGTGIGSHHLAYAKYSLVSHVFGFDIYGMYNVHDASSLFNRILSEIGIIGILFMVLFINKNFVKIRNDVEKFSSSEWVINSASLILILVSFVRKGHYFAGGLPLFIMFYYISKKKSNAAKLCVRNSRR